jgi:hypothetical protein
MIKTRTAVDDDDVNPDCSWFSVSGRRTFSLFVASDSLEFCLTVFCLAKSSVPSQTMQDLIHPKGVC